MALPRHLPFQQEVFKLFPSSFPQTAHELEAETETVARQLAESANKAPKWATSSNSGLAHFYKGATLAVVEYALQKPHAIDFLVTVYERATKLFPTEMNPSRDAAGWIARKMLLIVLYEVRGQDVEEGFVGNLANTGPADRYTITLNRIKSETETMKVMADFQLGDKHEAVQFVANALLARYFATSKTFQSDSGQNDFCEPMEKIFKQDPKSWSRAHFIGQCIFLRGCAKSLLQCEKNFYQRHAFVDYGIKKMEADLKKCLEDKDSMINYHAKLALANLMDGPKDETCEQLFDRKQWRY